LYFITDFENVREEESKPSELPKRKKKKMKKLSQTLRAYNSQTRETKIWVCGMLRHLHYENDVSSTREYRATYV